MTPRISRHLLLPLLALGGSACDGEPDVVIPADPSIELPVEWNAREARIVMRLTDASSTSTEVRRALGILFNGNPIDPTDDGIDPMQLLMRGAPKDPVTGAWLPPETGLSVADAVAGTALEQAALFKERVLDAEDPLSPAEAVDACGNPMFMAIVTPEALDTVIPGATELPAWPSSCASTECEPKTGSWDVALGERNFDGMIDMVVNILPSVAVDPVQPGVWGQLSALFLTGATPGEAMVPLFLNMRRLQINLTNVWELDSEYVDPAGRREVYKFPHRERVLTQADIFVFAEGHDKAEDVWEQDNAGVSLPFGLAEANPVGVDFTALAGEALVERTNGSELLSPALSDALNYQIAASLACPGPRETAYVQQGPLELFICPDGDIANCIARNDMDEGACLFPTEPVFDPFDPASFLSPRVTFARYAVSGSPLIPASNVPAYLTGATTGQIQIEVGPESAFYTMGEIVTAATGPHGPVVLPESVPNSHCEDTPSQRYNVGDEWPAGTYTLTVDLSAGIVDPDSTDGTANTWFYYTSPTAWIPN